MTKPFQDAFSVLWTSGRVQAARKLAPLAPPPKMLFGGPHLSQPSFRRAGVARDARLYVISVNGGRVGVHLACRVQEVATCEELLPEEFSAMADAAKQKRAGELIARSGWPEAAFYQALCVSCTSELVEVAPEGPMRFDRFLTPDQTRQFRFVNRQGKRVPKGVETGQASSPMAFRGIYRLAPGTAEMLAGVLLEGVAP